MILQHAEILGHQGSSVDETHRRLSVTLSVVVLLCHVLQPGQTEVRRRLIALRNPERGRRRSVLLLGLGFFSFSLFNQVKLALRLTSLFEEGQHTQETKLYISSKDANMGI